MRLISLKEAGEKVGEEKEGGPAVRSLFHSVGTVKLVDKATLIEFFH